jgi:sterol 3beta-glucosyltransferase
VKLAVATYGTDGDTRPFIALCRGLIHAGHEPVLLADRSVLQNLRSYDVPTVALSGDIRRAFDESTVQRVVPSGGGFRQTTRAIAKIANQNAEAWLRTIIEVAETCDVIVASGLAAFAAFSAAEYLGLPSVGAGTIPITPTSAFPSPFAPQTLPRMFNRISHRTVNTLLWRAFRRDINSARACFEMKPRRGVWEGLPMIYGASPSLLPAPADWPDDVRLCGQWTSDNPVWDPPSDLASFLASGEPPIYVGFGSIAGFASREMLDSIVESLSGRRALFYPGWTEIGAELLPANFHVLGNTPHDWLFQRISGAIHHGGSGTSHSAAKAGIPSVVVPFAGDQFFWAQRLRLAGVAQQPLAASELTSEALSRAIDFVDSSTARQYAHRLRERMLQETPIASAISLLEQVIAPAA